MAVTNKMYGPAVTNMFNGNFDLSDAYTTIKVGLLASYTYSEDHETWTAVKAAGAEASGVGYTAGGATLTHTGAEVTYASGVTTFGANADDTQWTSSTIDAAFAVVYDADTGLVLCVIDFGGTESSVDGTFKIEWHENGIFRATVNPT